MNGAESSCLQESWERLARGGPERWVEQRPQVGDQRSPKAIIVEDDVLLRMMVSDLCVQKAFRVDALPFSAQASCGTASWLARRRAERGS